MQKKTATVNVRLTDALRRRLDRIHERHATNDATVVTRLLEAFCENVERTGKVEFPIDITPAAQPTATPHKRAS